MAYLVPTFHHDIAYLRSEEVYTAGCFIILDEAVRILNENPEYHYFVEQAWLWEEYWEARPEKRDNLRKLVSEGRLCLEPAFYAVPDMTLPDGESIYMQAEIGQRIVKDTVGCKPRVAMITDCWGHHAQLPQILSQCGYEYYAFSRCMRHDVDRQNFVWRGIDGSTLKTHWMSTHYDGVRFPSNAAQENIGELEWAEAGEAGISDLMARNSEKCGDEPQYLPVGGDMTYPAASAPDIVKMLNARGVLPELIFASPAKALGAVDWQNTPEHTGDFMSSQQGSFTTNIWIKQLDRKLSGDLYSLEALSAAMQAKKDFSLVWKLHLKNQFHDIICGTICNSAYRDAEADFRAARHILTQMKRDLTSGAGKQGYFNALPFERTIRTDKGLLQLPSLGYADAECARKPEPCSVVPALPLHFENEWYRVQINEKGYIVSLIEKANGCELVSTTDANGKPAPFGALSMQMDYGDSWWTFAAPNLNRVTQAYTVNLPDPLFRDDRPTFMPVVKSVTVDQADEDRIVIRQTAELSYWIARVEYTTTITLSKSARAIAYHTEFVNQAKCIRIRAAFPVNNLTEIRRQIPYGVVPFGDGEQTTQMFMDARNDKAGLAVINNGTPAGIVENGVMLLSLFRSAAMEYKCDSDLSYNLGRRFAFDYQICPHAFGEDEAVWRSALEANTPVIMCQPSETDGLPEIDGAYISCIREKENGLFVRLYNPFADARCCRIRMPAGYRKAILTNGLGEPQNDSVVFEGAEFQLPLEACKVQGILFC